MRDSSSRRRFAHAYRSRIAYRFVAASSVAATFACAMAACGARPSSSGGICELAASGCWTTFVQRVDDCLIDDAVDGGAAAFGYLSADRSGCVYPTGRTVQFIHGSSGGLPSQPAGPPTGGDADFTVTLGARTCLHYVQHVQRYGSTDVITSIDATGPDGRTVSLRTDVPSLRVTVTCPDGRAFVIDRSSPPTCDATLPGADVIEAGGSLRSFSAMLAGARKRAYECIVR